MATEPRIIGETASPTESVPGPEGVPVSPSPPAGREIGGRDGPEPTRYGDWEKTAAASTSDAPHTPRPHTPPITRRTQPMATPKDRCPPS
ncbi:DUF1674 domain-containing protein [Arenimonas daejeonensis]|uniref:DUF1674 domain-containing protein n=1 Tax=Arenimonas daejeonensis TaxID=370777 RepID=UPI001D15D530